MVQLGWSAGNDLDNERAVFAAHVRVVDQTGELRIKVDVDMEVAPVLVADRGQGAGDGDAGSRECVA
jgi:hypothetical protein